MTSRYHPASSAQQSFVDLLFSSLESVAEVTAPLQETQPPEPVAFSSATLPILRVQLVQDAGMPVSQRRQIGSPEDAAPLFFAFLCDKDREYFVVLLLDTRNRVIGLNTVSIGTLDAAIAHPREVFKPAILAGAAAIIVCHNHPSGEAEPSAEDRAVTRRLAEAGALLGIPLLDHLIVGEGGAFCSLKARGAF